MREILFRGKAKPGEDAAGEWVLGDLLRNEDLESPITHIGWVEVYRDKTTGEICEKSRYFNEVIPESVGQYTGFEDEDEIKIFEGDIVSCSETDDPEYMGVVEFKDGCWAIKGERYHESLNMAMVRHTIKIVSNIYDYPELLESK